MAHELTSKETTQAVAIRVEQRVEIKHATDAAKKLATTLGFPSEDREEIILAVSELASNLVKHAGGGTIKLSPTEGRSGIQVESEDHGPGIPDVEQALTDGFSTAGSLGTGLGAVNRLMHDLEFHAVSPTGTRIVCQRWLKPKPPSPFARWLEFGAATRPYRGQLENGDAFFIRQWDGHALAAVVDGLGHGPFAHRASQTARCYLEQHYEQSLESLFRGVGRACSATRGVVMATVLFDLAGQTVTVASVGNVEVRVLGNPGPCNIIVRRGIVGLNAPKPVVTEHPWTPSSFLIMHSDGLRTQWTWDEFRELSWEAPALIARRLLQKLGKQDDDATVLVAKPSST